MSKNKNQLVSKIHYLYVKVKWECLCSECTYVGANEKELVNTRFSSKYPKLVACT